MPPFLTIDTFVKLGFSTVIHPFPALLTLLSVVALGNKTGSIASRISVIYFVLATLLYLFQRFDAKIASGAPRTTDWQDEVVVITGGAGGLGGLIAATYGMRGIPVAVLDVKQLKGQEKDEWQSKGINYYCCDVGNRREVEVIARTVEHDLGTPTILINNAAVVNGKQFFDLTEEDIERTYRVNVFSHYNTIQTFLPKMLLRPNGGTIVTVSSVLGYLGCAGLSDYTSSKAALTILHQSLRAELTLLATDPPSSPSKFPNTLLRHAQSQNPPTTSSSPAASRSKTETSPKTKPTTPPPNIYPSAIRLVLLTPGHISTSLFANISLPPLAAFFGPTVTPVDVAAETVRVIDAGVDGEVVMPLYARWIGLLGVLPRGLAGVVRGVAGVDSAGWRGSVLNGGGGGVKEE